MTRFFLVLLALFFSLMAAGQDYAASVAPATATPPRTTAAAAIPDKMAPTFPTAAGNFAAFIQEHLVYPDLARDYAIEGTVVVEVEVGADGRVTYVSLVKPLFEPLDRAAIDLIARLPRFEPAARDGRFVATKMMIPFKFSLR